MTGKAGGVVVLNCRTCTRACKQHKPLDEEIELGPEGSTTLASMLNYCAGLSFEPQDGAAMPQHICLNCLQLLEQAFNFKRMVIDSDELLRLGLDEAHGTSHQQNQQCQQNQLQHHENHDQQQHAGDPSEEYLMIEMLNEEQEPGTLEEQEVEADPHEHINEEEFVIEEVADHEEELTEEDQQHEQAGGQEEHITMESVHEFQPAEVEYVTIKDEFETIVTEEDEIEIMEESGAHDEILDGQMIVIPAEGAIDEVIGEEAIELDENEREEHLLPDGEDVCEEEDFLEESLDSTPLTTGEALPHVCSVCQKAFRQQCRLNQHMRSHVDEKHYECEECGKRLKHLRNYKEHMLTHTNVKPHQCNICDRFYRTTSSLAAHKRTHAEEKPYNCDQCGRGYAAYDHLRRHKLTHTGERPYACDLCDKAYYDSSSLRQHKISHTGEKAFTCEICGVGLSQKSGYKKHLLVHTGAKPHKCPICGRAFTFTSNLNAHVRLHSGEKPFKCEICMKAFPTKKRLNSHLRVHNKETPVMATAGGQSIDNRRRAVAGGAGAGGAANLHLTDVPEQPVSTSKVVVVL
ncbi:zinc finger protein 660 [Drosophila subpulchrella]|uniref:zinc finger protein 660 n=1 Tax=Drosophila subpulchrella TaxID=1486046 RepID=UPI0018A18F72|nr:zinc finger protein 660 [Drosophila subpulchrella]